MSAAPPPPNAVATLATLCDDAFFAIAGSGKLDLDNLRALAARRAGALRAAALGTPHPGLADWDAWLLSLCTAIAPIAPPRWLPMGEAILAGLSLEHGARGMRSLFTSKPSDKDVNRVRTQGAFAVRALGAVLTAASPFTPDARLLRAALIASLGLPEEEQRPLDAETPAGADALEAHGGYDAKIARAIVRGGFYAAMGDGLDPREDNAVTTIAYKLNLTTDDVNAARKEARDRIESSRDFGEACADAVRYLLADEPAEAERLAIAAARLTLPMVHRRDAITAINVGGPVVLGNKHPLDRREREGVLGLSWLVAIRGNPTYTRRVELASRHQRIAGDLGDDSDGPTIRGTLDRLIEVLLAEALESAATS